MPESTTAQTMPAPPAANELCAASALTVLIDLLMSGLQREVRPDVIDRAILPRYLAVGLCEILDGLRVEPREDILRALGLHLLVRTHRDILCPSRVVDRFARMASIRRSPSRAHP